MPKYYFTFGQAHVHTVQGNVFDKDSIAEIEAPDYGAARDIMFSHCGTVWAFQYPESALTERMLSFYPRGIFPIT
jgi:hypothetical protein